MTSMTQQGATAIIQATQSTQEIPEYLDLPSDGSPVIVNVTYENGIAFSLPSNTDKGRNLSWRAGGYALFITFNFEDCRILEAVAITPLCWLSSSFNDKKDKYSVTQQACCTPPVPGTYHIGFDVELDAGNPAIIVDPKIVVTPVIIELERKSRRTRA